MGEHNPNTPAARGMETRYVWSWQAPDWTTNHAGIFQRIRPGAVTISSVHLLQPRVKGTPGVAVEVVDDIQPDATYTDFPPGTDTGATVVNFEDQAGAALNFGDVNDKFDTTDYARNSTALSATGAAFMGWRGNAAGALAGKRILRVQIQALVMNRNVSGNAPAIPVRGWVFDGGTDTRYGNWRSVPKMDSYQLLPDLGDWLLSPFTGLPWTVTEVNNIISAAVDDTFGMDVFGKAADEGVRVNAMWLRVWHCPENRKGFYYGRGGVALGWWEYTLSSTSALSANTYYWVGVDTLSKSQASYLSLGYVWPNEGMPADDPTISTQDHRTTTGVLLSGPGGVGQAGADKVTGNGQTAAAILYEVGGTIQAGSQPYGEVGYHYFASNDPSGTLLGQQITTDSSQPAGGYAGVTLPVGWLADWARPDRPFVVSVRSGVGAISGGGTLVATATLRPERFVSDPTFTDVFIPFDGGNVTLSNSTLYTLLFDSDCVQPWAAWKIPYNDTRSDLIETGSTTTVANIEGASQGGQTDRHVNNGTAYGRWDYPIAFTAPPDNTSTVAVTVYDAVETDFTPTPYATLPPRVRLTWTATSLGASFGGYRVWIRRRATPIEQPILVGEVNTHEELGFLNSTIESQHREFWLYELGWSVDGGYFEDGWDIGMSVRNGVNGLESLIEWAAQGAIQPGASQSSWLCSNAAPWLNTPLPVITRDDSSDPMHDPPVIEEVAGRDHNIVRVTGQVPGRKYELAWGSDVDYPDEHLLAGVRAAAVSGRQVALLRCRGQRNFGVIKEPSTDVEDVQLAASASFWTTGTVDGTQEEIADANFPAGYVLNGTSQRFDHPDNALLDPGTGPFTIVLYGLFPTTSGATHLSKDNGTTGYEFRNSSASTFSARVRSGTGTLTLTDATAAADGNADVMVLTSPGTGTGTKTLYRDGEAVTTGTTNHGTIANSDALSVGGDGGASFSALNPLHGYGVWLEELTETQVQKLTFYLQGHAGMKAAAGASLFVDLRDQRSYGHVSVIQDLSGNDLDATLIASPTARGLPWRLSELERKR